MLLSIAPAAYADVASQYIDTRYYCYVIVEVSEESPLRLGPTDNTDAVYTLPVGTRLVVTETILNIYNYVWYKVEYYGQTLYIWNGYTTFVEQLADDVTTTGLLSPASLCYGDEFYVEGEIQTYANCISCVTASVYKGTDITKGAAASSSEDLQSNTYTLTDSNIAGTLPFSSLNPGIYTYVLTATVQSTYYSSGWHTVTKDVIVDRQTLIITYYEKYTDPQSVGIDVSEANEVVDWEKAKDDIDFAILRLAEGTTPDSQFQANVQGCIDNGIPFGVSLYSLATTEEDALAEAMLTVQTLAQLEQAPVYGVWFDIEDYVQTKLSAELRETIVKTYVETVSDRGYLAGMYSQLSWYYNYFNEVYYKTIPKWIAQTEDFTDDGTHTYEGGTWMHQYTWTGRVSGVEGDVSWNYCYFPIADMEDTVSFLSQCGHYHSHAIGTATSPLNIRQYPSTDYSVVSTYEEDEEVYVTGLYKTPDGAYWYQVVQGAIRGFAHSSWINISSVLFDDVSIINPSMTSHYEYSEHPEIRGKLMSKASRISHVYAKVYCGEDTSQSPALSEYISVYNDEFNLYDSQLCKNLALESLLSGYYTLEISASITNYIISDGSLTSQSRNVILWQHRFTVGEGTVAPSSCAHTPVEDAAIAATCTSTGMTKGSHCSTCGSIISFQYTTSTIPHTYEDSVCTVCGASCSHNFQNGSCTDCGLACTHSYSNGACTICGIACKHVYADGVCSVCGYNCTHSYVSGKCFLCGNICSHSYEDGVCTSCGTVCNHSFNGTVCTVCKYECIHEYVDSYCSICESWCPHNFVDNYCVDCGIEQPDYYLFGWINGANYACEDDAENMGEYHFVDGQLTATFTENSYVAVKLGDNSVWYMTDGWLGETVTSAVLTDESMLSSPNKLFVPGLREIVFTLVTNTDGTITLSYEVASCAHSWQEGTCTICGETCSHEWSDDHTCTLCGKEVNIPTFTLKNYSVSFDGEVRYNIYYTVDNIKGVGVEDMGLITWSSAQPTGTVDTANEIIPGALTDGTQFMVHSTGIAAKCLGDNLYFKIYAKLEDGSYAYSDLKSVNAKTYAIGRINKSTDANMKALAVAMLNYGAAAQTYFNYKSYNLMNASLTEEQQALVQAYDASMVADPVAVSTEKAGSFVKNGFGTCSITASFEGAFVLNYYLNTTYTPDGDVTLYYWTLDGFNKVDVLTKDNATGSMVTLPTDVTNQYWGEVTGIAAKELDQTVFVTAVYTSGGVEYSTTVMNYSMGRYCVKLAADDTSAQQALAQATAVYGYYAKQYFASLYS